MHNLKLQRQKHRGIGILPNEAIKEENRSAVILAQEKYANEFRGNYTNSILDDYRVGDGDLIQNETKNSKIDDEYKNEGQLL